MKNIIYVLLCGVLASCGAKKTELVAMEMEVSEDINHPADGFNFEASDPEAIIIADKVMTAMGGRKAWDETRYLSWNFFGKRSLLWDKFTGDVRIEIPDKNQILLVNINSMNGKAQIEGEEISAPDSLAGYLKKAKSIWINDSYWLVMPYKLKDSGVALYYIGNDTTALGQESYVLQMAFDNVGDTPDNIYHIWVDEESNLITQWAFFRKSSHPNPDFITPWEDYQKYGNILLSGGRGGARQLTEIKILSDVPDKAFTSFEPVNYND
ncbi:hypothetical protein N7E81_00655 [Reichenbachiella carrageenanivorans]|uniref:Uncharacterized protein n=1 Tax=Reichenbachiella carrageenanivorans TaxID=2979869 RepID=A0ABY6D1X6_9BACT|nr:hypothetical protein [Reichenbachiella carrageenanivorans]UXX79620.1 hypothetical protein N7E81_00655 [Reichenbachiella carrageenanivorans]